MRERELERKLVQAVKATDGICPKFVSPGFDGMPDRIVLLHHGKLAFVEVKRPGQKARSLQAARHKLLRQLGFQVFLLDEAGQIGEIINAVQST